jgi:hypothetical protein
VITNHFHLVIRTPKGTLVYGMFRGLWPTRLAA